MKKIIVVLILTIITTLSGCQKEELDVPEIKIWFEGNQFANSFLGIDVSILNQENLEVNSSEEMVQFLQLHGPIVESDLSNYHSLNQIDYYDDLLESNNKIMKADLHVFDIFEVYNDVMNSVKPKTVEASLVYLQEVYGELTETEILVPLDINDSEGPYFANPYRYIFINENYIYEYTETIDDWSSKTTQTRIHYGEDGILFDRIEHLGDSESLILNYTVFKENVGYIQLKYSMYGNDEYSTDMFEITIDDFVYNTYETYNISIQGEFNNIGYQIYSKEDKMMAWYNVNEDEGKVWEYAKIIDDKYKVILSEGYVGEVTLFVDLGLVDGFDTIKQDANEATVLYNGSIKVFQNYFDVDRICNNYYQCSYMLERDFNNIEYLNDSVFDDTPLGITDFTISDFLLEMNNQSTRLSNQIGFFSANNEEYFKVFNKEFLLSEPEELLNLFLPLDVIEYINKTE